MRTRMRHGMAAVAVGAVALLAAGCASAHGAEIAASAEPGDVVEGIELPERDLAAWRLPLPSLFPGVEGGLGNHAENVLVAACLEGAGLDWPIPEEDVAEIDASTHGRAPLTQEWADAHGYHTAGEVDVAGQEAHQLLNRIAGSTPGFETAFQDCLDGVREQHDWSRIEVEIINGILSPGLTFAAERAAEDEEVAAAARTWSRCLAEAGFERRTDDPTLMPTTADAEDWGLTGLKDVVPWPAPTAAEIELASADAACRATSGWNAERYDAEWTAQVAYIVEHADEIRAQRDRWSELRTEMLAAVDGYTVEG
ncbi:hypothetical protein [Microbacterium sp. JZ101]